MEQDTDEDTDGASQEEVPAGINPWPYLEKDYFKFLRQDGKALSFKCRLCTSFKTVKADTTSRGNLVKHMHRHHDSRFRAFQKLLDSSAYRPRSGKSESQSSQSQNSLIGYMGSGRKVTQANVDSKILSFVVLTGQSFRIVDHPAFIDLVSTLEPSKKILSRKSLMPKLKDKYNAMRTKIIDELVKVRNVLNLNV